MRANALKRMSKRQCPLLWLCSAMQLCNKTNVNQPTTTIRGNTPDELAADERGISGTNEASDAGERERERKREEERGSDGVASWVCIDDDR